MNIRISALLLLAFASLSIFAQKAESKKDKNGNNYTSYTNDPSNSRWYILENGLTVILAQNSKKPRVQTLIATKAGSSSDPADNTGLAHYLEHMLFKGTDKYGSLDYVKEKVLLAEIDKLYEKYNQTTDDTERKNTYAEIDRVSGEAAKYAIANEYDKMLQAIGAQGTNAFTSFERTVYVNDVPSNQVTTWLDIEAERFRNPILRLFHTELEAVYEEKNRGLDNDGRQVYEKLLAESFPNHNYGRQTTIGTIEHLKNPSLVKIRNYYNTYYVPNNMAVIMVGDINLDNTFEDVKRRFAYMKRKEVPKMTFENEVPLAETKKIEVVGPSQESMMMGYRVPSGNNEQADLVNLVDLILANSSVGLIDLNLVKAQKCIQAYCSPMMLKDRGLHYFAGSPLEGQTLEELEGLFYDQINKLKTGDFDMELVKSIVLNQKVNKIKEYDSYRSTAYSLMDAFVMNNRWSKELGTLDKMLTYTKKDVIDFAKKYYADGHVVVYKRKGEKKETIKVEKPQITKVEVNRGEISDFVSSIMAREIKPITAQVLDYNNEIEFGEADGSIPLWKVKKGDEQLFSLYYVLDLGSRHDQKLALAVEYLKFLGTNKYSADEISTEFYKLACNFGVSTGADQSYVYLNGLASSFDEAIKLFEHLLANAVADESKLEQLVAQKLKSRADAKLSKGAIMSKLRNYALYGEENPSTYFISADELRSISGKELEQYIHQLTSNTHKVWYSGPLTLSSLTSSINKYHKIPETFIPTPVKKEFKMLDTEGNSVLFAHYDMVQAEVMWLKKSTELNVEESADIQMFNEYFGGGMSSIVFQEIREAKALAYSTYSYYSPARKLGENNTVIAYVGTQSDKMKDGIEAMNILLSDLPLDEKTFENGKQALKQNLETSRILKTSILFDYDSALKLGLKEDKRKMTSERLNNIQMEDIQQFYEEKIKGEFTYIILGDKNKIDFDYLSKYGDLTELNLEQLFGY
ncbi:insulinase family protein [Bacteroidia bacterium]|nr:insulinase family protein [Bacteroidia bacterium]MDC1395593.1 insulinase family protein [Bacteroidia bacterium]